jgi:1-acyl-sn-glycerol-3-phosphate acyltransferase
VRRGRKIGFWFRLAVIILKPLMTLFTRRDWRGMEHLQRTGGIVLCVNHISYFDPLAFAHFVYDAGRLPRFLAKAALFELPFIGRVLRGTGQIPVYRESTDAAKAFSAAVDAVNEGGCVCIYPEATVTRDPAMWPMQGKTGAARVALATGAPVIPIAQWGAQQVLPPYTKRPRLLPPRTMHVVAGPPVDLSDLAGEEPTAEVLRVATARIIDAITELLEQIRGEQAPEPRLDPRSTGLPTTGNPRRRQASP